MNKEITITPSEIKQAIDDLLNENHLLKERIKYLERSNDRREDTIIELRQENNDLEDNWNKLKEFLENNWKETQDIWFVKIINKMKEVENYDNY